MKLKFVLIALMALISTTASAESLKVVLDPQKPVVDEPFIVRFVIETDSDEEPYISFDPGSAEVLGRERTGTSIQTTLIQGRFTTRREVSYEYRMVANRPGSVTISNIRVELGDKVLRHGNVHTRVLREPERPKDIFVLAEPSKTTAYVGEAIDVDYWLYFRVPVVAYEIKEYPKLNGFIKRFHMPNETMETAEYNGVRYKRSLKYTARVYPEKAGVAKIDPLKLRVQWSPNAQNSPFGLFGMGNRRYRVTNVGNSPVEINILPLPTENLPPSFTGLVGEHQFNLTINKQKFLVNEAIELKLTVEGPGALEKMDAPVILRHPQLEEFDTRTEITEQGTSRATKTFEYTYLGRGPVSLAAKDLELFYFDPDSRSYEKVSLPVPAIQIAGSAVASDPSRKTENVASASNNEKPSPVVSSPSHSGLLSPLFEKAPLSERWVIYANALIGTALVILLGTMFFQGQADRSVKRELNTLCKKIKRTGPQYPLVHKLITLLQKDGHVQHSLRHIIDSSQLSSDAKGYFKRLVAISEKISYDSGIKNAAFEYRSGYFKQLLAEALRRRKNGDSSQS